MKRCLLLLLGLSILGFLSMAQGLQSSSLEGPEHTLYSFVSDWKDLLRMYPQERVYLHFDNTAYFLGDTVWFKGYVTQSCENRFSMISKVLYVELLTQEGVTIDSRKLRVEDGQCHGEFAIPNYCRSGFYEVRAYTRYMMNWGGDWAFSRVLPVYDKPLEEGDYSQQAMTGYSHLQQFFPNRGDPEGREKSNSVNVRFFPEGGFLVLGVPSRVAFQVTDGDGLGMDAVLSFPSKKGLSVKVTELQQGMGSFDYTPGKGKAEMEVVCGLKKSRFKLPGFLKEGYSIRVDALAEPTLRVLLRRSLGLKPEPLGLSVFFRDKCSWFHTLSMEGDSLLLTIPSDSLSGGVNRITLFDSGGETLCERMFFVSPDVADRISLLTEKKVYRPYEKVDLAFRTVPGSVFSLSVRDRGGEIVSSRANILTDLLLSSEVRGYIPDATYYFEDMSDPFRRSSLDLLLMVQGWRRYTVPRNMESMSLFPLRAEDGLIIEGRLVPDVDIPGSSAGTGKKKNKAAPIEDSLPSTRLGDLRLYMDDMERKGRGEPYRIAVRLDSSGRFRLQWPDFVGKHPFCLYAVDNSDLNALSHASRFRILLDRVFDPSPRPYSPQETKPEKEVIVKLMSTSSEPGFLDSSDVRRRIDQMQLLKPVFVESKRKAFPVAFFIYDVDRDKIRWRDQGEPVPSRFWLYLNKKGLPAEKICSSNNEFYNQNDPSARFSSRLWMSYHNPEEQAQWVPGTMYKGRRNRYFLQKSNLDIGFLETSEYHKIVSDRMFLRSPQMENWEKMHHSYISSYFLDMDTGKELRMDIRGYVGIRKEVFEDDQIPMDRVSKIIIYDNKRRFSYREERTYNSYLTDLFFVKYPKSAFIDEMPKPYIRFTQMDGYSMPKGFSSGNALPLPGADDYRRTLYWNPDVRADSSGLASVWFYNNSRCRNIVISAEGLTLEGVPLVLK